MADVTYTTGEVRKAIGKLLGKEIGSDVFPAWRDRGYWPLEEQGKGWTRYEVTDVARLFIMAELMQRFGVERPYAFHVARARKLTWPSVGDRRRYLVFHQGEVALMDAKGIGDMLEEEDSCSAIVVDASRATARVAEALRSVVSGELKR